MARKSPPTPPKTASQKLDHSLAASALKKMRSGLAPTDREAAALRRVEARREEEARWRHYQSIPKKHYVEMAGRQHKVLNDQAHRYGVPVGTGRREIDLTAVVRWLHDFLVDNAAKLAPNEDDLLQGDETPALEAYRREAAAIKRLQRLEMEQKLLSRDKMQRGLAGLAEKLRRAGEDFERMFGPPALERLNELIESYENDLARMFTAPANTGPSLDEDPYAHNSVTVDNAAPAYP